MSKETLKSLRILIPGILIFLFTIPLFNPKPDIAEIIDKLTLLATGTYMVVAFTIGAFYYTLNIRYYFLRQSLGAIHENIKEKLLEPFKNTPSIYNHKEKLKAGNILINNCFYPLIDNNETLKEKAKNVHLNGLIWTTIADISAISIIYCLINFACWLVLTNTHFIIWSIIFLLVYILFSQIGMKRITSLHIEKSNEQLDFIQINLKEALKELLLNAINSLGVK